MKLHLLYNLTVCFYFRYCISKVIVLIISIHYYYYDYMHVSHLIAITVPQKCS